MIFNVPNHIQYIRNGLRRLPADNLNSPMELRIIKTQTRRRHRGEYEVGKDYAVQRKQGVEAEPDIRIVMDKIWVEGYADPCYISKEDALAEGGYSPIGFELAFREIYPQWNGISRWAFEFHVMEVQR